MHRALLRLALLVAVVGCSRPDAPPTQVDIDEYLAALPSWAEFSRPLPDVDPQPVTGEDPVHYTEIDSYEIISDDAVQTVSDAVYNCVSVPYTMTSTPEDIVMLDPDLELLWPGALLQGRSHRDGIGSLDPLPISARAPIEISIPAIASANNFRTVESPTQAQVASAIGSIVGDAVAAEIITPSSISYEENTFSSEQQFALSIDASGRYLGFSAKAGLDVDSKQTRNTIAAQFYQRMYEVVVAPPETPGAIFSDAFTDADYQQQEALGRIGPDNLPIYVSNVVYGRMMTFSMTSNASEEELRAILNASYEALVGGVQLEIEGKDKQILESAEIRIATLGGAAEGALEMIRTGNLRDYFASDVPLSSAVPLSYTFRNLGDNSIASVSEAIEYEVTECTARLPGEVFDMVPVQSFPAPVPVPYTAAVGDFDGDEVDDLVWNHLGADGNVWAFAYGSPEGAFTPGPAYTHPSAPSQGWAAYDLAVGDFDANGVDDLVWNNLGSGNTVYLARFDGETWNADEGQVLGWASPSWDELGYELEIGDVDGIPGDDLVWNTIAADALNDTTAVSYNPEGWWMDVIDDFERDETCCWTKYERLLGDVNADGRDDLVFWKPYVPGVAGFGAIEQNVATGAGFVAGEHTTTLFADTPIALGDITGDGRADIVQEGGGQIAADHFMIYVAADCADPGCGAAFEWSADDEAFELLAAGAAWDLADVNGDGLADVVMHSAAGATQQLQVAFADGDGELYGTPVQSSPFSVLSWAPFDVLYGDFDGNGTSDLVWHQPGVDAQIYLEPSHSP